MKRIFLPVFLLLLTLFISNCGGDSNPVTPSITPTATATLTPVTGTTDDAIVKTSDIIGAVENGGLAYLNYREDIGIGPSIAGSAVTVPPLPSVPPTVPSGTPVRTRSESYTLDDITVNINMYLYLAGTILNPQTRADWVETELYLTTPVSVSYGAISAPTPQAVLSSEAREFTVSRWVDTGVLRTYTIGTGIHNTLDPYQVSFTGTQVLIFPREVGDRTQLAYNFTCSRNSDGSMRGTLEFDNATGTFERSAINTGAIGTTAQYAQITGSIDITATVANPDVTFTNTIYGDGSVTLVKTFSNSVVATRTYKADGSGTGSITGIPNTTIELVWDDTGEGMATVTVNSVVITYDIYVPPPHLYFIPEEE